MSEENQSSQIIADSTSPRAHALPLGGSGLSGAFARPVIPTTQLASTFSAFGYPAYRLYFVGLLVSVIGTWSQTVAQNWLVYQITNSPLALGLVTAAPAIPLLLTGPWAGVIIDHNSKRLILVITQTVMMLQAFVLAWLTFSGLVGIELIIALSAVLGVANAFDAPARQAFLVELVEGKENLSNAIALNSTMFSLARAVGPSIGGIIAGTLGAAWAFMINGISFLAILISLFVMRVPPSEVKSAHQSPFKDLAEGGRYILSSKAVIGLLGVALMISVFGASLTTLLPVITRDVLGGDEIVFGLLNGAIGVGSIIGGLIMAYLSRQSGRGKNLSILNLLFPIMLTIFASVKTYQLSGLMLIGVGIAFIPQFSLCNMLLQSIIPDDLRGRVMSIYTLVIFGGTPLGGLISAAAAEHIGAPLTIIISAVCMGATAVLLRVFIPEINALD